MRLNDWRRTLVEPGGFVPVGADRSVTRKVAMLFQGGSEGLGPSRATAKSGVSEQRYLPGT